MLSSPAYPEEYRVNYTLGTPQKMEVGTYQYRLIRQYYQDATGSFIVEPGLLSVVDVTQQPNFATLSVRANTNNFTLSAEDNNAPTTTQRNTIFLERGIRRVSVSAPGYETTIISIRANAGATIDTTVTLFTPQQSADRLQIESLPRGVLIIQSDVDAEIFVNGESRGTGEVSLTLVPDSYDIEARHRIGRQRYTIQVPSADVITHTFELKPKRSSAYTLSALIPGAGHLYTRRSRGYIYLGVAAALGAYSYMAMQDQQKYQDAFETSIASYGSARSVSLAAVFKQNAIDSYNKQIDSYNQVKLGLTVVAGIYALQLLDVLITRPKYGYRENQSKKLQTGVTGNGVILTLRLD
jgi:hypothetical protein